MAWRTESSRRARPPVGGRAVVGTSAAYKRADGYPRPVTTPRRAPGGFPVVGIIGGGQLARMCAGPAAELGITLSVLAESDEASAALVVPSSPVADHTEADAVHAFARHCDVVTFDHEHVPPHVLELLVAEGVQLHPRPEALTYAQDKLAMRQRLTELGIPCPRWARASTSADVTAFGDQVGWPVVETVQTDGVCTEVLAPAPDLDVGLSSSAVHAALRVAGALDVTGVLAVELFEVGDDGGDPSFVVNVLGDDLGDLRARAGHAADYIRGVVTE